MHDKSDEACVYDAVYFSADGRLLRKSQNSHFSGTKQQILVHSSSALLLLLDHTMTTGHAGNRLKESAFRKSKVQIISSNKQHFVSNLWPCLWFWPFFLPPHLIQSLSRWQSSSNLMVMTTCVTLRSALTASGFLCPEFIPPSWLPAFSPPESHTDYLASDFSPSNWAVASSRGPDCTLIVSSALCESTGCLPVLVDWNRT